MADKSYKLTLSLSDGSTINAGTITAPQGPNGANGVTFTPSVSAAGVLSWTNNGGLTNPSPISIKGPKGDDAVITASDVEGWGFTKNTGTITEIKMNGVSKGTSGVVDLGTVLTDDGGTIKNSKTIKMDASANSNGANLKWGTVNHKNPYIGYASDQSDGTFVIGSLLGTNYASGLAIGGGSGNLLWKGTKVATISDINGKLDKTTYEVNKTINFGSSGALYVGKFNVYDTNVTCEVTSTTDVTYSGKLVIATQNYVITKMTVYGDAANTVAPNFYVKPSSESNPYIEVYFKPSSWSKNVVHIYGSNIQAEPTNVCTNVPSIPSTATLKPKNALPIYSLSGTTLTITL